MNITSSEWALLLFGGWIAATVSGAAGAITIVQQNDPDHYIPIATIPTAEGTHMSFFITIGSSKRVADYSICTALIASSGSP
jgi:hypothetical protein